MHVRTLWQQAGQDDNSNMSESKASSEQQDTVAPSATMPCVADLTVSDQESGTVLLDITTAVVQKMGCRYIISFSLRSTIAVKLQQSVPNSTVLTAVQECPSIECCPVWNLRYV